MKVKLFLATLLFAIGGTVFSHAQGTYLTSLDQVESEKYYRIYSLAYNTTMAMSEASTGSNNIFCDTPNENDYMQVWKIVVSGATATKKTVTLQNVVSGRWVNRSSNNFHTHPTAQTYTMELTETGFIIYNGNGFHHQQSGHDVVSYGTGSAASKWQLEEATINETALAAQKEEYNGYVSLVNNKAAITTALAKYFTDTSCSTLKSTYQDYTDETLTDAMTTDGIPQTAITMALKVKNNSWETYATGWDHTEKTFRIGSYAPVSKESRWRSLTKVGYALSPNSDPTGIYAEANQIITVYVDMIPSGQSVILRNVPRQSGSGDGYTLSAGFNILKTQSAGMLFVDYEVDNTTNGAAPFTPISSYPNITIHIEGGKVNGAFYATRGDTNEDWVLMREHLFKHYDYLQLRSRNVIFNMRDSLVKDACPEKMTELLEQWDFIVEMEHNIMGLDDEFPGYFNTPMMAVSFTGSGHMYASTYGTYYNENTVSDVMRYENLFAGGSLWGPAHEIGHINQAAINIIGQSEVSNNVFSNIAVFLNGHLTSRTEYIQTTLKNMADSVYWQDRGIWERTHMYFQLYQFFQTQGYRPNFYQDFFRALRADPTTRKQNTFIDATDDYLKFYKKACEVSGYDLTEFFQAYGFFIVPEQTSYTANNETRDAFWVGDYGTYYLVVTQAMIDSAITQVKKMNLPKANIVFIEDRISAPDATYEGATPGTKKTAFSGYPFGKGDVGQYTDFVPTVAAQGYKASYVEDHDGDLDVSVNHTEASGAVGFKVYDKDHHLVYLSNTYKFTVPSAIYSKIKGTDFKIVAAGPDGEDQDMEADNNFVEWVVKDSVGNILKKHFQITHIGDSIKEYPEELNAPFVSLSGLVPFEYVTNMTDEQKEVEVLATISTPFKSSTDSLAYYYIVHTNKGFLCQTVSEDISIPTLTLQSSSDTTKAAYRWAFYGNPYDGYRIKNKATGQWICAGTGYNSNGNHPILSSTDPTSWLLAVGNNNNTNRFHLYIKPGTSSRYLNDYGGHGTNLAYYGNGSDFGVIKEVPTLMPTTSIHLTSHLSSFSYPQALTVPEDVNVFTVTGYDENSITVQWLETKVIPAETGVLLYSNGGGKKILSLGAWVDQEVDNQYTGNLLSHTATAEHTVTAAQNIYALKLGQTAFAHVAAGVQIPLEKAYLELSANSAPLLPIDFGDATDVKTIVLPSGPMDKDSAYDLNGLAVSCDHKGIIIIKGIKVLQR